MYIVVARLIYFYLPRDKDKDGTSISVDGFPLSLCDYYIETISG
jgi:hypothetical protein